MTNPQQISFSQYVDGASLQISKMLHKISEVATALEAELQEKTKLIERLEAEKTLVAGSGEPVVVKRIVKSTKKK